MAQIQIDDIALHDFTEMVKKHDWYYHNSDSMKVVDAGEKAERQIRKRMIEIGDEAKKIYNQFAPAEFQVT